jgi:esterase/lipase superfamily enzyme
MNREYHKWFSPALGRDMELLIYGHGGARVLVFPTSKGRFYEWEDRGMIGVLGEHLERGWLQITCVDSIDAESWYARWRHPGERVWRHRQYEEYLLEEVLPLTWHKNQNPFLITTGASFGAYHALNFALRHPFLTSRTLGMSGIYSVEPWTDGFYDENVYYNSPCDFIAHEHDGARLDALRRLDIILAVGRDDGLRGSSERLSAVLWEKGIGCALRLWDGWSHDWQYWQKMLVLYIGGHD